MTAFSTSFKEQLAARHRLLVVACELTIGREQVSGSQSISFTVLVNAPSGGVRPIALTNLGPTGLDAIAMSFGRQLIGQDFELYGDARTSTSVEISDTMPGMVASMLGALGESVPERLSDLLSNGWHMTGQDAVFYLGEVRDESVSDAARKLGSFTVTGVSFGAGSLRLTIADEKPWNRRVPLTRLYKDELGTGWTEIVTKNKGEPIPIHYGIRGRGPWLTAATGGLWETANAAAFQGRADPMSPAPMILMEADSQNLHTRLSFGLDETGRLGSGLWWSLGSEGVYMDVGQGRLAYIGASSLLPSDDLYLRVPQVANPITPTTPRIIAELEAAPENITGQLAVFPAAHSAKDSTWESYESDHDNSNPAAMFDGDLRRVCLLSGISSTATYGELLWALPNETNYGAVTNIEGFALVRVPGVADKVDLRMKLDTDFGGISPTKLGIASATGLQVITFNLSIYKDNDTLAAGVRDWRFSYNDGTGSAKRMRLGIAVRKNSGSASNPTVYFHSVGITATFQPSAFWSGEEQQIIRSAQQQLPNGDLVPVWPFVAQLDTYREPELNNPATVYMTGKAHPDGGAGIYADPGAVITSPVGILLHQLYEFTDPSPAPTIVHSDWVTQRGILDSLIAQLGGGGLGATDWNASYSVTSYRDVWAIVTEFMGHLPILVWRDREGFARCAIWWPENLPGFPFSPPAGYIYETALGPDVGLDPSQVKRARRIGLSPVDQVYNEVSIQWNWHSGRREYLDRGLLNKDTFDDGEVAFSGFSLFQQLAEDSQKQHGRRSMPTIQARTVNRRPETIALLNHYLLKHVRRHLELDVDLDIQCADIEPYQFLRFSDAAGAERFNFASPPILGGAWSDHLFRVVKRIIDYDSESVTVSLRSVAGVL